MKKKEKNLKIWNIPNIITACRIVLTLLALYFILAKFPIVYVVAAFSIGAITDFLDGQIARRFNMATEFGRKFDIIADRFLMITVVGGVLLSSLTTEYLSKWNILQIFIILSREILTAPFFLIAYLTKKPIVHARFIGKLTTFLQGFAFPSILLSVEYSFFSYASYLSVVTGIVGVFSAIEYIKDVKKDRTK